MQNIYTYIHIAQYYSALKKEKEILLLATTWMDLECITLSKVSQTNVVRSHLCAESKNINS